MASSSRVIERSQGKGWLKPAEERTKEAPEPEKKYSKNTYVATSPDESYYSQRLKREVTFRDAQMQGLVPMIDTRVDLAVREVLRVFASYPDEDYVSRKTLEKALKEWRISMKGDDGVSWKRGVKLGYLIRMGFLKRLPKPPRGYYALTSKAILVGGKKTGT